ncbi:hypothetical protein K493DRAFT_340774 [Basidiobolus meristosporus CBS 931.73]|uniref:Uncharacterized protein n=1 Tax=Basidiobolus meristosporus CBS 931.73 TaxID=1314790 RepID=A0A1Y1XU51_9FUNG|nr:hypothetical protein K493DRAFT_340774 [Basidiobolus meristosporus CBS 931.73]|eukprot:ORX89243.1 hypothetical protein K493DRAFT_340774 [Basidiobolus meristosporus CBS 931.73]
MASIMITSLERLGDLYDAYVLHISNPNATSNILSKLDKHATLTEQSNDQEYIPSGPEPAPKAEEKSYTKYHEARWDVNNVELSYLQTNLTKNITLGLMGFLTCNKMYLAKEKLLKAVRSVSKASAVMSAAAMAMKKMQMAILIKSVVFYYVGRGVPVMIMLLMCDVLKSAKEFSGSERQVVPVQCGIHSQIVGSLGTSRLGRIAKFLGNFDDSV